jgi:hypothetical protein
MERFEQFMVRSNEYLDQNPAALVVLILIFVALVVMKRRQKKEGDKLSPPSVGNPDKLDTPLLRWTEQDYFRVRDLLNGGMLILGRAGSGKTSSSGRTLMQAIVSNPKSGGLILAAKPEDVEDIKREFRNAGRLGDLIIFDADSRWRTNFFGELRRPRDVVTFIMTLSEIMKRGDGKGGGDNSRFYEAQEERCIYNAVAALQTAKEPITAPNLHRFIMTAATSVEQLKTPEWQEDYHSKILERGFHAPKSAIEKHDYQLCADFWIKEWAMLMDAKTRGNILAGVQGVMHTMNTGIVREMVSNEANCSPQDVLDGRWLLVNFPPSVWGAAGQLICAGWKQIMELAILERQADKDSPFVTIWCDEAHQFVTNYDSSFIAQCRSHKGCLFYLTQSVSSFYAAMKGEVSKHQADALLANFSHVIVHTCDPVTAKWASAKLGKKKEMLYGGSSSPRHDADLWDLIRGRQDVTSSFNEQYQPVLQEEKFMIGRTGGPANNFEADATLLRSGEPFANGKSYLRMTFSQKG